MKQMGIIKAELIGENVKVTKSTNNDLIGIEGKIVDETKNLFIIETKKGDKKVAKAQCIFQIGDKKIDGKHLVGRPEMRIKKSLSKKRV